MLGHGATGQFAIGEFGPAETITADKWYAALSTPPRQKRGLSAGAQRFTTLHPAPIVPFSWFASLSTPVRFKKSVPPPAQQFIALHPAPSPFVATGWFRPLSEPVRKKPGTGGPQLAPFFASDTTPIPLQELIEWFMPWSEPVRFRPGLKPSLQQFLAWPPKLLPTASITAQLSASEQFDVLLASLRTYNAVFSADVGVLEIARTRSPVGIIENLQKLGNVSIEASLPTVSSGAAVTSAVTARVAIREV